MQPRKVNGAQEESLVTMQSVQQLRQHPKQQQQASKAGASSDAGASSSAAAHSKAADPSSAAAPVYKSEQWCDVCENELGKGSCKACFYIVEHPLPLPKRVRKDPVTVGNALCYLRGVFTCDLSL